MLVIDMLTCIPKIYAHTRTSLVLMWVFTPSVTIFYGLYLFWKNYNTVYLTKASFAYSSGSSLPQASPSTSAEVSLFFSSRPFGLNKWIITLHFIITSLLPWGYLVSSVCYACDFPALFLAVLGIADTPPTASCDDFEVDIIYRINLDWGLWK